jgi:hypothetical protein
MVTCACTKAKGLQIQDQLCYILRPFYMEKKIMIWGQPWEKKVDPYLKNNLKQKKKNARSMT